VNIARVPGCPVATVLGIIATKMKICFIRHENVVNPLTPNVPYSGRTAPLTSKRCILYIYSKNTGTEYFKRGIGETGFSWHTFHFLIFYNFLRNDTEKKMILLARVILRLCKKI